MHGTDATDGPPKDGPGTKQDAGETGALDSSLASGVTPVSPPAGKEPPPPGKGDTERMENAGGPPLPPSPLGRETASASSAGGQEQPPLDDEKPAGPVEPPPDVTPADRSAKVEPLKIKKSKLKNFNVSHGENTIFAKRFTVLGNAQQEEARTPRPLLELTSVLPAPEPGAAEFVAGDVEPRHRRLMVERLLLISCVDAVVGRAAAQAVTSGLGAAPGEARLLSFDRLAADDVPKTIYDVIRAPGERLGDVLVVVDA